MGILQARILEWVAMPSSRGSSQPRDWNQVFCIVGSFFTIWVTREAYEYWSGWPIPSAGSFLTQESVLGLLQWRWLLYQPSYPGSPKHTHIWLRTKVCIGYSNRQLQFWSLLNILQVCELLLWVLILVRTNLNKVLCMFNKYQLSTKYLPGCYPMACRGVTELF